MLKQHSNEKLIGKWSVYYIDTHGERFNGKLIVSDYSVYFKANFHLKSSGVEDIEGHITIPIENIQRVDVLKYMYIFKRFRLILKDKKTYLFDRGILPVKSIMKSIYTYSTPKTRLS